MDGLCYVINALNYNSSAKFTRMCTIDCTRNNQSSNYDSNAKFTKMCTIDCTRNNLSLQLHYDSNAMLNLLGCVVCTIDCTRNNQSSNYDSNAKFTKMCTIDCTRNN